METTSLRMPILWVLGVSIISIEKRERRAHILNGANEYYTLGSTNIPIHFHLYLKYSTISAKGIKLQEFPAYSFDKIVM